MPQDTLHAFYDLGVSTNSFDILSFLVVAERARRDGGHEQLAIIIVPPNENIKFPEQLYDLDHEVWRIQNILVASCWLLQSCKSVTVAETRDHANEILEKMCKAIFPKKYTVEAPVSSHHTAWPIIAAHEGENLQCLYASSQARSYARQWIEAHSQGKKAVALTLREAKFTPKRNSDMAAWTKFAQDLRQAGFFPIVLRDIETALEASQNQFSGIAEFPEAVFNLDLRIGLYEECHICAFVSNGPSTPCYFNEKTRYLYFVSGEWLEEIPGPSGRIGLKHGAQPPFTNHFQRWIWKSQDAEMFMEEFTALDEFICETEKSGTYDNLLSPIETNREDTLLVAERISKWSYPMDDPVPAEMDILSYVLSKSIPSPETKSLIQRIQGIYEMKTGNIDAALNCFELAIKLGNDEQSLDMILRLKSALLDDLGVIRICEKAIENGTDKPVIIQLLEKSRSNLNQISSLNFGYFSARAQQFLAIHSHDRAEEILEAAYGQWDRRGMYCQLAMIYKAMDHHEKSAETLKRAVDDGYGDPVILFNLGIELIEANYYSKAIDVFEFLQGREKNSQQITLALGELYELTDQADAALACYRRAQQNNMANSEINDRESRLAQSNTPD